MLLEPKDSRKLKPVREGTAQPGGNWKRGEEERRGEQLAKARGQALVCAEARPSSVGSVVSAVGPCGSLGGDSVLLRDYRCDETP